MEFSILGNGQVRLDCDMDEGFCNGRMEVSLRGTGFRGKQMGEEDLCFKMAIFMKVTS